MELSEQDKAELQRQLDDLGEEEQRLQAKVEELQASNDFTKEQLTNMKAKMEALRENNGDTPRISEQENRGTRLFFVVLFFAEFSWDFLCRTWWIIVVSLKFLLSNLLCEPCGLFRKVI